MVRKLLTNKSMLLSMFGNGFKIKTSVCYCGIVRDLQGQELLFEGEKGKKKIPGNLTKAKANINRASGLVQ
jgi:hypothetical protein